MWTMHVDVARVKENILDAVEGLKKDLLATHAVLCLSMGETFRHQMYPAYKAGRGRKPLGVGEVKRWLIDEQEARLILGIEADDALGIMHTHPSRPRGETIVVSPDKDLRTVPGLLYQRGDVLTITPEEAEREWLTQTLTGDSTDGYPGCPGIGSVRAKAVLDKAEDGDLWGAVVAAYEKAGLTADDALLQARLARILRHPDYDFKAKEPILWTPQAAR